MLPRIEIVPRLCLSTFGFHVVVNAQSSRFFKLPSIMWQYFTNCLKIRMTLYSKQSFHHFNVFSKKRPISYEIRYCRGLFVLHLLVILLWRKFIYRINQRVECLINPGIVFPFPRQRWSIVPPSVHIYSLVGVNIKYTQYTSSTYFLL